MCQIARLLAVAALIAALVTLPTNHGSHSAAVACALLGTALVLGEVTSSYRADGVTVDVVDNGPGQPAAAPAGHGGGTGLAGLHERARLLGGRLEAGGCPEGGFAVRAFLPGQ